MIDIFSPSPVPSSPSKIRRLLVFIRLLYSTVTLFYMPLMTGMAFAFLASLLFCRTNENFRSFGLTYLMINQYFIKPRAIYVSLTENHPYLGPYFVFFLGFCINFFMVNFFIVFINEAYSSIQNQVWSTGHCFLFLSLFSLGPILWKRS